jgi:formyltetrahydrofolate hydrolase
MISAMSENQFVVTLTCEDKPGIVAAVTTELAAVGANIAESNQFWDRQTNRFFLRIAFTTPDNVDRDGDRARAEAGIRALLMKMSDLRSRSVRRSSSWCRNSTTRCCTCSTRSGSAG